MNWNELQQSADEILAYGVKQLKDSEKKGFDNISMSNFGNYLISGHNLNYIGESKDVTKRIKQHSKEKTSTFYRTKLIFPQTLLLLERPTQALAHSTFP